MAKTQSFWITLVLLASQITHAQTPPSGALLVKKIVNQAKASILVDGKTNEEAYQLMGRLMSDAQVTSADLISFVSQYASEDERHLFTRAIELGSKAQENGSPYHSFVLSQISSSGSRRGSDFKISCAVGLGVGIPLALAGAVLTLISLRNQIRKNHVQEDYADKVGQTTQAFLNHQGALDVQKSNYNALLGTAQIQATELQRKIDSGVYNSAQVASFQSQLQELQSSIQSYKEKIGSLSVDLSLSQIEYDLAMSKIAQSESAELRSLGRHQGLYLGAGLTGILAGAPLIVFGSKDCKN
ncbi:MAG: hypothetical protein JNL01_06310 [Bdellovibrionales bacterium]|nr:hypothetical protein [Bdellovibrionales bacterium]